MKALNAFYNSFPIKLLLVHVKYNQFLLLYWFFLFSIVAGGFGKALGIPYLFLDPIYLDSVGFKGFFIVGVTLGGFAMAFNITSYILDGFRFPFLGTLPRPFTHFCLNNSVIPFGFLIFYVVKVVEFARDYGLYSDRQILYSVSGLLAGFIAMQALLFIYFTMTNRDIRVVMRRRARKQIKAGAKQKQNAFRRLQRLKRSTVPCNNYLSINLRFYSTRRYEKYYDRVAILGIFRQNQRNAIIAESFLLIVIFALGLFQQSPLFQIPAAASSIILLTVIILATGALSFWLRSWVVSAAFLLLLFANVISSALNLGYEYPAYGLDYSQEKTPYNINSIRAISEQSDVDVSTDYWLQMLKNWKAKTGEEKPEMFLVAVSGGGQRSALWATNVMQHIDSVKQGTLMKNTFLITGASGGLVGAAFYRELYWKSENPRRRIHRSEIGNELLNPLIFKLLVNDIFFKVKNFDYAGQTYKVERGYTFEQNLSKNLNGALDRPLAAYRDPEFNGEIPALLLSPLITNDGRKLYISPHPVSFLNYSTERNTVIQGVDFRALLKNHQPDSLRFLTAIRMSATFPYVVPTITLPTEPPIQIADAGISDNYGIVDALIFLNVFKDWIKENTSQVTLITIRDSVKEEELSAPEPQNIMERFFSPIQSVYKSWDKVQTIKNDQWYELTKEIFKDHLNRVEFEYTNGDDDRASLSWRLTEFEKQNIIESIHQVDNQRALEKLKR
ncbi:patatin-like phospholipase family protein [uncultured Roseivirga sp.]|uniref:patatin-like phospholipase family protein n=1 Tax=uncultured Roseivirga sp. TaxID=543088 RepID=UPI000D7B068A|nr:patatin-like phospholipase family protein [uncultured Roseivirga sp.]PWL29267.1 MAG: phospholipase [Roseivirga sp. XM-24bin3]